jgi:CrcB protein
MWWNFLLVAVGGAVGSVARYGLNVVLKNYELLQTLAVHRDNSLTAVALPWGTLGANVLGCFFIGLFSEWAESKFGMSPEVRLLLTTGFCGGFTTLSTLMLEMNDFFRDREWAFGALYVLLSLVLPFVALWAGIGLVKLFERT